MPIPTTPTVNEIAPRTVRASQLSFVGMLAVGALLTAGILWFALQGAEWMLVPAAADALPAGHPPTQNQAMDPTPDIQGMVDRLAARLKDDPQNGAGWQKLARSYAVLGRYSDAAMAYGKATALLPPNADLLADHADVLAMAQSGRFDGEPAKLIQAALALDPKHGKALTLAGTEAFERKDYDSAETSWNKALESVPADSELAASVRSGLDEIRGLRDGSGKASSR